MNSAVKPNNVDDFPSSYVLCSLVRNTVKFFLFECHYSHCTILSCMLNCIAAIYVNHHLFVQMLQLVP